MTDTFVYDLVMALIPGTIAGYYSGLLMAKQTKFNSLKHEALRCIRSVNYVGDDKSTQFQKHERLEDLHLVASELLHLKHRRAGEKVLNISYEAGNMVASFEPARIDVATVRENMEKWQKQIRELRPGLRFLLPWGQI